MSPEEILEGNKLIVHSPFSHEGMRKIIDQDIKDYGESHYMDLKYHSSWDWLMPVVERIFVQREVERFNISPGKAFLLFKNGDIIDSPCKPQNNSITETFIVVIEFIKRYNQQNL